MQLRKTHLQWNPGWGPQQPPHPLPPHHPSLLGLSHNHNLGTRGWGYISTASPLFLLGLLAQALGLTLNYFPLQLSWFRGSRFYEHACPQKVAAAPNPLREESDTTEQLHFHFSLVLFLIYLFGCARC